MEVTLLLSLGSLLVAFWLAALRWREYSKDKKLAEKANMEKDFKAPAERDSIIVAGAAEAVAVLKLTLSDTREERDSLRARLDAQDVIIADQDKRIRYLEKELARYTYEGRRTE
jgi:hypothetical protein